MTIADLTISLPILIALISSVAGLIGGLLAALIAHRLTRNREIEAKRREIASTKLVEAWLALDAASDRPGVRTGDKQKMEEAIRHIVLFAEDDDIDMAERVAKSINLDPSTDWTELLKSLRQKIRDSMGIKGKPRHFWFAIQGKHQPAINGKKEPDKTKLK